MPKRFATSASCFSALLSIEVDPKN
jgi:hypothetical protein